MACSPPRLIPFFWQASSIFSYGLNINVEQNHSLPGCHLYLQGILFLINLFCLTTGCTLTETVMWENYQWQQQVHYQEGKCKFLCIMIGSLNQMDWKLQLKGFNNNIQSQTRVKLFCLKAIVRQGLQPLSSAKTCLFSRLILVIPGGVVIALMSNLYAKQWYMTEFSH